MVVPAVSINLVHVLVAAIASMVVGFVWYGPLFGKLWIHLSGMGQKDMAKAKAKGMGKSYFITFLGSFVTAYVLAHFLKYVSAATVGDAIQLALWLTIGFIATVALGTVLWENKTWKLYFLKVSHEFVSLSVMAIILALWV